MDNETHLVNLNKIISEDGESVFSDAQNDFYQEIADNVFMMPPLYSNGNKIKYMLWNYPNLKSDIKSKLGYEIISKWKAFNGTPKDKPSMELSAPKIPKKQLSEQSKEREPAPEQDVIQTPPVETPKIINAEKTHEMKKPVIDKTAPEPPAPLKVSVKSKPVKKAAAQKAPSPKPAQKKPVTRKSAAKKVTPKKKTSAASATTNSGLKKIKQTKEKTLKNDVDDLSRSMKALEGKIEKMMKTFDSIGL